jgi:hypothetical protein
VHLCNLICIQRWNNRGRGTSTPQHAPRPPTDIASLIRVARQTLQGGFGRTPYWFRGHAQADWTLVPSVHRHYDNLGERDLINRFRLGAPTRYSNCPEARDVAGWITLMQHFGLPTRLLDWTGSLIVAAYFAVSHEPRPGSGPAAIWVLLPNGLNKASSHASDSIFLLGLPGHSRRAAGHHHHQPALFLGAPVLAEVAKRSGHGGASAAPELPRLGGGQTVLGCVSADTAVRHHPSPAVCERGLGRVRIRVVSLGPRGEGWCSEPLHEDRRSIAGTLSLWVYQRSARRGLRWNAKDGAEAVRPWNRCA